MTSHTFAAVIAVAAMTLAACGGTSEPPTAAELAESLVVPEDLEGEWAPDELFAEWPDGEPGVVPEEQRGMMPVIEFCDAASDEAKAAAADLAWQVFTQLNMELPEITSSAEPGNMVAVQEAMLAGDEAEVTATFAALSDGVTACLGGPTEVESGGSYTSESLPVGDLGDERVATHDVLTESAAPVVWTNNAVVVRDGAVLVSINVIEVLLGEGTEPMLSEADVQAILTTAAEKLP